MKLIDISGQRFGRLVVLEKAPTPRMWRCICDCGTETHSTGPNLRSGSIRSCGCLATEWATFMGSNPSFVAKRAEKAVRHGHKRRSGKSIEYNTWLGMKRRCFDQSYKDYPTWGGRGITVCDRWNKSFESFLADMGARPSPMHSIDRLNHDGHYEPGNCRWATPYEQATENKRGLKAVTVRGASYSTTAAACRALNVPYGRTMMRLAAGESVESAFFATRVDLAKKRARESYLPRSRR